MAYPRIRRRKIDLFYLFLGKSVADPENNRNFATEGVRFVPCHIILAYAE